MILIKTICNINNHQISRLHHPHNKDKKYKKKKENHGLKINWILYKKSLIPMPLLTWLDYKN